MSQAFDPVQRHDTCFFERYAQILLATFLGEGFAALVNRDRPDLQSPDGHALGIEVTRAMDESKKAEEALLKDISGATPTPDDGAVAEFGYAYGLRTGKFIGEKEYTYWSMALPLRRILESKVAKVGNGFYGQFERMGLFVFSRENLREAEAVKAMNYTLSLQKGLEIRYNRLYLADVDDLFVCNLDEGLKLSSRLVRYRITQDLRKTFYLEAVRCRNEA